MADAFLDSIQELFGIIALMAPYKQQMDKTLCQLVQNNPNNALSKYTLHMENAGLIKRMYLRTLNTSTNTKFSSHVLGIRVALLLGSRKLANQDLVAQIHMFYYCCLMLVTRNKKQITYCRISERIFYAFSFQ
ncbi:hypothetical protein SDC9_204505 [bioreactor metagenome]|uniref:Uncharacterized protein n=1 Tax=bioreactor metagenome TaxID=1076179 RepID=A0A645J136_9ZZZZ